MSPSSWGDSNAEPRHGGRQPAAENGVQRGRRAPNDPVGAIVRHLEARR